MLLLKRLKLYIRILLTFKFVVFLNAYRNIIQTLEIVDNILMKMATMSLN